MSTRRTLTVQVVSGRNLAPKDSNGFSDPYVYVWCYPDKTRCKTKIIFKTLNPTWNESFEFEVDTAEPESSLRIEVWDHDNFSSDDFMGTCSMPISSFIGKDVVDEWYPLQQRPNKRESVSGDIRLKIFIAEANSQQGFFSFQAKEPEKRFVDIVSEEELKTLSPTERKRQEIIFEFINTESQYCKDLKIIINSFLEPIRERSIITNRDILLIFSNVEELSPVNEALLADLLARQQQNPIIEVFSDIFLAHVEKLTAYSLYCSNQTAATEHVETLREKNPQFASFIDEHRAECRNLPLQGFLVKPLQRLCKYPLLLRELVRETPPNHADIVHLNSAYAKIKTIVDNANERTRQVEQFKKFHLLKELLKKSNCDEVLSFGRKFIIQVNPLILRDKPFEVIAILFNDLLFVCKQKKDVVFPLKSFPLRETHFRSLSEPLGDYQNVIEIKLIDDVWKFEMNSADEKRLFYSKIMELKDNLLYDEVISRESSLTSDEQLKSTREFVEGESELFDMKVKILELIEVIKKERSLRIIAERSNNLSKQKILELSNTVDVLQSQVDLAQSLIVNPPPTKTRFNDLDCNNNNSNNNGSNQNLNNNNNNVNLASSDNLLAIHGLKKKKTPSKKKIGKRKKRSLKDGDAELTFQEKAFLRRSRSFDLTNTSIEELYLSRKNRNNRKLKRTKSKDKEKMTRDNNNNNSVSVSSDNLKRNDRKLTKSVKIESLEDTITRLKNENITLHAIILKQKEFRNNLLDQVTALGRENRKLEDQLKSLQPTLSP